MKGTIEIIRVLDANSSLARITSLYDPDGYEIPLNDPNTGVGTYDLPERGFDFKNTNRIATADYTWSATKSTLSPSARAA